MLAGRYLLVLLATASCTVKLKTSVEPAAAGTLAFSWAVQATFKGTLAYMHVKATEVQKKKIQVASYLTPTEAGESYLDKQPVRVFDVDDTYKTGDDRYNGATLPLRLRWMVAQRRKQVRAIEVFVQEVSAQEAELLQLANACYQDFSELHIAKYDHFKFSNLNTQREIKFAGKKFVDRDKVSKEITRRAKELQDKKISYKKKRACQQPEGYTPQAQIDMFTSRARTLRSDSQLPAALPLAKLPFDASARGDTYFMQLSHYMVQLRQVRLLLAEALLQLYQPLKTVFHYTVGVKKFIDITVIPDDRKQDNSFFGYEMRATNSDSEEYTLGKINFNSALAVSGMWLSLKPRGGGGLSGFAKLNFKSCAMPAASNCPPASFK